MEAFSDDLIYCMSVWFSGGHFILPEYGVSAFIVVQYLKDFSVSEGTAMIDHAKLKSVLSGYQTYFSQHWLHGEDFKWEAAQHFHDHWNIDAADFGEMFKEATAKVFSLLDTGYAYPRAMILNFAAADCEATRAMFRGLFDEAVGLPQRITAFQSAAEALRIKYNDGSWNNHYQNTSAISVYLWLRYPDQYYIYRYSVAHDISDALNFDAPPKRDGSVESLLNSYRLYDELRAALSQNAAITQIIRSTIDAAPAGKYWPDTHWNIAAIDLGFYLSRFYLAEQKTAQMQAGWFPAKSEYDPGITTTQWSTLLQDTSVFTPEALRVMKCMLDYGGQATCKQLAIKYGETSNFYISNSYHLAQRVAEKTGCRVMPRDNESMRWWPILYVGKNTSTKADGTYIWRLRDELLQALKKADLSKIPAAAAACEAPSRHYWWLTANPKIWSYSSLRVGEEQTYTLYNDNGNKRRIFQNFLDAKAGDLVIGYEANPVKRVVALAKITQESNGKEIYFEKTESLTSPIEYAALKSFPELEKMEFFVQPNGSLFKLSEGEYKFIMDLIRDENPAPVRQAASDSYTKADFLNDVFLNEQRYDVLVSLLRHKKNIILQGAPGVGKTYAAKRLAYSMMGQADSSRVEFVQFHQNYSYEDFMLGYRPDGSGFKLTEGVFYRFCQRASNDPGREYFFLIDEINRGNLSKIFGELMMLIESDHRGEKITLAYNGMPFYVPENLYIIGMMNTADRSLAMIDYALRRRFSFFEIEPAFTSDGFQKYQSALDNETFNALVEQIKALNREITTDASLGPGFRVGHSYFCLADPAACTTDWMRSVVEFDLLPTLAEYWFDAPDKLHRWEKNLRGVFNDD